MTREIALMLHEFCSPGTLPLPFQFVLTPVQPLAAVTNLLLLPRNKCVPNTINTPKPGLTTSEIQD